MYGRFTLTIVMVKWPYTIGVKYLTSQPTQAKIKEATVSFTEVYSYTVLVVWLQRFYKNS